MRRKGGRPRRIFGGLEWLGAVPLLPAEPLIADPNMNMSLPRWEADFPTIAAPQFPSPQDSPRSETFSGWAFATVATACGSLSLYFAARSIVNQDLDFGPVACRHHADWPGCAAKRSLLASSSRRSRRVSTAR